nr:MAG TPA: hypothetical protein [Caudoviricetes sp.]
MPIFIVCCNSCNRYFYINRIFYISSLNIL